ncbi:MAG: hypothetical protein ACKO1F_03150 [Flammeovirgaceae bacterium]
MHNKHKINYGRAPRPLPQSPRTLGSSCTLQAPSLRALFPSAASGGFPLPSLTLTTSQPINP